MTVETSECNGVCESSEAEFVASQMDPKKSGGECNDVAFGNGEANGVEGNGDVKDDGDGSYVFVNGETDELAERDLDVDGEVDSSESSGIQSSAAEDVALPPNVTSEFVGKLAENEDLSCEKADGGELVLEDLGDFEEGGVSNSISVVVGHENVNGKNASDAVQEKSVPQTDPEPAVVMEENGKSNEANNDGGDLCMEDDRDDQVTNEEVAVNGTVEEQTGAELAANDTVEEQADPETAVEVEKIQDPEIMATETVGSEPLPLENEKEMGMSNVINEISPEKSSDDLRMDSESKSEAGSVIDAQEGSIEGSEKVTLCTVDNVELKVEASNGLPETCESTPACPVDTLESENAATYDQVQSQESFTSSTVNDKGLVMEMIISIDNVELQLEANRSAGSEEELSAHPAGDVDSETKIEKVSTESNATASSSFSSETKLESEVMDLSCENQEVVSVCPEANGSVGSEEKLSAHPAVDMDSETKIEKVSTESNATASSCCTSETKLESEVTDLSCENQEVVSVCPEVETKLVENGEGVSACLDDVTELETEASNVSAETDKEEIIDHLDDVKEESEIVSESVEHGESTTSSIRDDHSANRDEGNKVVSREDDIVEEVHENGVLPSPSEDPGSLVLQEQKTDADVKRLPCFMVRIPRFSDDKLKVQIQLAQQQVDEKTQRRDSIRVKIQKQKVVCAEYREKLEAARKEERAARDAISAKRQEIDSIQLTLNKIKNADSIGDIDDRMHKLQHRMQHETIPLKEEKQLIREINQLRQNREHLSSNMASQEELHEAFEQREQTENRLKHLKEDLDSLRRELTHAEVNTKSAKMKFDEQCQFSRDLHDQFKTADDLRQEAYTRLRNLKTQSFEKNKCFYAYKDDAKVAANYQFAGNREALQSHCSNQVEKVMRLWNENDEFRNQYVEANMVSTVRRFRTLDGRSLGPDEEPLVLGKTTEEKVSNNPSLSSKINMTLPVAASEKKQEEPDAPLASKKADLVHDPKVSAKNQSEKTDLKQGMKVAPKNQPGKSKKATKPSSREVVVALILSAEDEKEEIEENKRTEEEEQRRKAEELARKEEELKKEKAASELKERLRLEQIAKAREAEERKRRMAKKAEAKAEIKAQKEAELREKKRAKKEKKKAGTSTDSENPSGEAEAATVSSDVTLPGNVGEPENKATVASRKPSRPSAAAKQLNRITPLPPALRNKGKRKMQTWMWWVLLATLVVLSVFVMGNYSFSKFSWPNFGI